tara:strand:- start:697 stop:1842 length:1146 start_codon:yes stop_codon:yes gene_type:complete
VPLGQFAMLNLSKIRKQQMNKTNPLDFSYEEKVKMCSYEASEGEKFHGFLEVPFKKINGIGGGKILNLVRDELDEAKVTKFKVAVETGNWSYAFEPPRLTISGKEFDMGDWSVDDLDLATLICNLQSGEHRITGASLARRESLLFAIVSYKDAYWQIINQSTENIDDLEYIKAERTDKQIVMAIDLALKIRKFDINDDDQINIVLKDLRLPVGKYEHWREEVRTANSDIVPIKTYKDAARREWILENIDSSIEFSSNANHIVQGSDERIDICKTFKGGSGQGGLDDSDYDNRLSDEAFGYLMTKDCKNLNIYASYKNHRGSEDRLNKFRKRKEHMLENKLKFYRKVVEAADKGIFNLDTDVTWKHLPQTQDECELNEVVTL